MLASFPHSVSALNMQPNTPWWLGEKYDGVRCVWNADEQQLYTRHGHTIHLPQAVSNLFGHVCADGEVWCGRGMYLEASSLILSYA